MNSRPEARDPAELLKKHFTVMQVSGEDPPRYVMSERNRLRMEKILERVKQLRNQR